MLRLDESSWDNQEIDAINDCLSRDSTTMAEAVFNFEANFSSYVGAKFAIMVNSGSSANLIGAHALTLKFPIVGEKNVVIVPALSWSTTYFPWIQLGYDLKFVDINLGNFNINTDLILDAIDENVVGICVPHILGAAANIGEIIKICVNKDIWLFEDACESLGNSPKEFNNKMVGAIGNIGTYSFFRSHHISTMEGGMVVTDDEELAIYARSLRTHGWARNFQPNKFLQNYDKDAWASKFKFYLPGYNVRPLEISGAIGNIQLRKLDGFLEKRRNNARLLKEVLKNINILKLQDQELSGSWMAFAFTCQPGLQRNIVKILESNGIETRPVVTGNFINQPVLKRFDNRYSVYGELVNAEYIDENGVMFANHGRDLEKEILELGRILESI